MSYIQDINITNVNFPWVSIIFNDFILTSEEGRPDRFISLTNKKVKDQADTTTVQFTYVPQPGEDPNLIEEKIVAAQGECYIKYGYSAQNSVAQYKCLVVNYSVTSTSGGLTYTMELISKSILYNYDKLTINIPKGTSSENALNILKDICEVYTDYEFDVENSAKSFTVDSDIKGEDRSVILSIENVLSQFNLNANKYLVEGTAEASQYRHHLQLVVDNSEMKVRVKEIDPSNVVASYTFEWNSKNNGVISWSTEYQGSVAIFTSRGGERPTTTYDDKGNIVVYKPDSGWVESDDFWSTSTLRNINTSAMTSDWWNKNANYCYKAKMTVLGNPHGDVQIGDYVTVNVFYAKQPHHTSGTYLVLGVTDDISSSGFTTTYDLAKWVENDKRPVLVHYDPPKFVIMKDENGNNVRPRSHTGEQEY